MLKYIYIKNLYNLMFYFYTINKTLNYYFIYLNFFVKKFNLNFFVVLKFLILKSIFSLIYKYIYLRDINVKRSKLYKKKRYYNFYKLFHKYLNNNFSFLSKFGFYLFFSNLTCNALNYFF